MVLSRKLDDKEIQLKNQSQIFFQISGAGHEAVLVAAGHDAASRATTGSIPYYRDRALCLHARRHAARDAARARSARRTIRRPAAARCRRTGATSALNIVSQSSPTGTQCLHAVGAPKPASSTSSVDADPDGRDRASTPTKSSTSRSATARPAKASSGKSLNAACIAQLPVALPRRRQRLRDLGAGRSADAGRRHLAARRVVSRPARRCDRRHRLPRQLPRDARGGRTTRARARARRSSTRRCIRPYSHSLSDDEKLYKTPDERDAEARRDPIARLRRVPARRRASPPTRELDGDRRRRRARGQRRGRQALAAPRSRRRDTADALRLLARRRSDVGRVRHAGRSPKASPTRWSRRSTAR